MLFKNIDEIRALIPISTAVDLTRLSPHITQAENAYIKPLMLDLYDTISQVYQSQSAPGETRANIIKAAQNAIIHLAYYRGFEILNSYISDGGFKRLESEKVKSLFKYQEDNLKFYFKETGFNALDELLEAMDVFATTSNPKLIDKAWYKAYHSDFINNATEFDDIYDIGNSRLVFIRLKKFMQQAKDLQLKQVFGVDNWLYICTEIAKETPADKVKAILPFVRKPLCYLSAALLMEETGADLTDKGLVYDGKISQNGGDNAKIPADADRVEKLIKRNREIGEAYLIDLKNYLIDHSSDWANYTAKKAGLHNRDNTGRKTFWA